MNLVDKFKNCKAVQGDLSSGLNNFKTQVSSAFSTITTQITARSNMIDSVVTAFSQSSEMLTGEISKVSQWRAEPIEVPAEIITNVFDTLIATDNNIKTITTSTGDVITLTFDNTVKAIYTCGQEWMNATTGYMQTFMRTLSGAGVTIDSVLKDLVADGEITALFSEVSSAIQNAIDVSSSVNTIILKYTNSKYAEVRSVVDTVRNGFQSGGIYGLLQSINTYYRSLTSLNDNGDGTFSFTDNQAFIPQAWGAGVFDVAYTLVSAAITGILAVVNPIIGMIAGALSMLGKTLISAYNSTYLQQYALLIPEGDRVLPFLPYAPWKYEIYASNLPDFLREAIIDMGVYFGYFKTYGGYILYGVTEYQPNSTGLPYKIGVEFHPDAVDRVSSANAMWLAINNYQAGGSPILRYASRSAVLWTSGSTEYRRVNLEFTGIGNRQDYIKYYLDRTLTDPVGSLFTPDATGDKRGYLTPDHEIQRLEKVISANFFIFLCQFMLNTTITLSLLVGYDSLDPTAVAYMGQDHFVGTNASHEWNLAFRFSDYSSYGSWPVHINLWNESGTTRVLEIGNRSNPANYVYDEIGRDVVDANSNTYYTVTNTSRIYDLSSCFPYNNNYVYPVTVPKYTMGSVIAGLIAYGIATICVVAVVCYASYAVKRSLAEKRALSSAKVGKAWDDLQENPTSENYAAYRKAAKKNNRLASVIGGTKYDVDDYWFGDQFSSADSISPNYIASEVDLTPIMHVITGE